MCEVVDLQSYDIVVAIQVYSEDQLIAKVPSSP
jgi:hypothetical protein